MIYLDHGATSFPKPPAVRQAVLRGLERCANPGRGGYPAAMAAAKCLYDCRAAAGELFHCLPEQVVLTTSCTHGLNMAIRTLVKPGDPVVISGFEHNAVVRPLHALGAGITVAGRRLFDPADTLRDWETALKTRPKAAVCTHVSNVFGYVLPLEDIAALCRRYGVPLIVDAAQSAGSIPIDFGALGAAFLAVPGHKGLLGPQGTGLLLCARTPEPLFYGGTGGSSLPRTMPEELPERGEAGTVNVPGIAGLTAGIRRVLARTPQAIGRHERMLATHCARGLRAMGYRVFTGPHQSGTVSFLPSGDCEEVADHFARHGIALRAGLHCAPLAHETAGTLQTGTLRLSIGADTTGADCKAFLKTAQALRRDGKA